MTAELPLPYFFPNVHKPNGWRLLLSSLGDFLELLFDVHALDIIHQVRRYLESHGLSQQIVTLNSYIVTEMLDYIYEGLGLLWIVG